MQIEYDFGVIIGMIIVIEMVNFVLEIILVMVWYLGIVVVVGLYGLVFVVNQVELGVVFYFQVIFNIGIVVVFMFIFIF